MMTATIHRVLMTIGGIAGGLGAIWQLSEVQILSIPPEVGGVSALVAALAILSANTIRAQWGTS